MKSVNKILILFFCLIESVYGQSITWQKTYGDENINYGYSIVQTPDSGFIAVGRTRINSTNYILVLRLDKYGDTIWNKVFNGFEARRLIQTSDNHYVICSIYSLFKININGNLIWTKPGIEDRIKATCDNGFVGCWDSRVRKFNSNGDTIWSRDFSKYISDGNFTDLNVYQDQIFLIGTIGTDLQKNERFKMKVGSNGDLIAIQEFVWGYTPQEFVIEKNGYFTVSAQSTRIAKFDSLGNKEWERNYLIDSTESLVTFSFIKTYDNGYALTGYLGNTSSDYYVQLIKTDSLGYFKWRSLFGFGDHDQGRNLKQTFDSGFAIVGFRENFNLGDVYVIKTDKEGYAQPPVYVSNISSMVPENQQLLQNFPNPFNASTVITFCISKRDFAVIDIFDSRGRKILRLTESIYDKGTYRFYYDASNLTSGIYYCQLKSSNQTNFIKMILLK